VTLLRHVTLASSRLSASQRLQSFENGWHCAVDFHPEELPHGSKQTGCPPRCRISPSGHRVRRAVTHRVPLKADSIGLAVAGVRPSTAGTDEDKVTGVNTVELTV
jgi:hypothetical protein